MTPRGWFSQRPAAEEAEKDPIAKLGAWLAGGTALIAAALSIAGFASGQIQRVFRNSPAEAALWAGLIGLKPLVLPV